MIRQLQFIGLAVVLMAVAQGCRKDTKSKESTGAQPALEMTVGEAGRQYKQDQDYRSLIVLTRNLKEGMSRLEVESLLGDPHYSPIEGTTYYYSNRLEDSKDGNPNKVHVGLTIQYRTIDGRVTNRLQRFEVGPIAE